MTNEVFANNLEIACKAGEGVATAAFPDPCWSPPPPSAGPIVIPYPNTAKASDTANGSKTVFISGKPVMLKNKSYFNTSTGNEPATQAFKKGVKTGVIKGKCYFASWSMNVKIEGYNVCRHTDSTTHNHASHPGNTGRWKFTDSSHLKGDCKEDMDRVGKACGGLIPKNPDKHGKPKPRSWWKRTFGGSAYKAKRGDVDWKKTNCAGLNTKPLDLKDKKLEEIQHDVRNQLDQLGNLQESLNGLIDGVIGELVETIQDKAIKAAAKRAVGAAAAGTGVGLIVTLISAVDAYYDIQEGIELAKQLKYMKAEVDRFTASIANTRDNLNKFLNGELEREALNDTVADLQRTFATANPCLRAKKCHLDSYENANKQNKIKKPQIGCCPGQTPHHLIPDSYIANAGPSKPCPKYRRKDAPTVCAEGTTHTMENGSHGALHKHLDEELDGMKAVKSNGALSYEDARDAAVESHQRTFPFSRCSGACLKAQLDKYYSKKCKLDLQYTKMPGGIDAGSGATGRD